MRTIACNSYTDPPLRDLVTITVSERHCFVRSFRHSKSEEMNQIFALLAKSEKQNSILRLTLLM